MINVEEIKKYVENRVNEDIKKIKPFDESLKIKTKRV